jgi:hypothetical protein
VAVGLVEDGVTGSHGGFGGLWGGVGGFKKRGEKG